MSETPKQKGGANTAEVVHLERRMLLSRHCEGDPTAFPELVTLYRAQVYSYIVRCGIDPAARDDLFQEIFIKVHTNARQYQPERPLEPWLFTIVANTVRSHYRRERVREIVAQHSLESQSDRQPSVEAQVHSRETAAWLEAQISRLPFSQREILTLCCFSGLNQKDISKILDIPVNTVKTHLSRARATLATALARRNAVLRREAAS